MVRPATMDNGRPGLTGDGPGTNGSSGPNDHAAPTLYENVAARIAAMIDGGTFGPGDRLPSVRSLHAQLDVSVTTVLEAYRLLEDRGVVHARPQSGYFVRPRALWEQNGRRDRRQGRAAPVPRVIDESAPSTPTAPEPAISTPSPEPTPVDTDALVRTLIREHHRPGLVELGMALPDPALMPAAKLNRIMAAMGRRHPLRAIEYEMPPGCHALRVQLARRALAAGAR